MDPFKKRYYYLLELQYLGYRFHGWQKQPNVKTLHLMVDKTLAYILESVSFKTLASGRTDAMVSAQQTAIELFIEEPIVDFKTFLSLFNYNLPQDIKALSITEVNASFNIINHPKEKEYVYLFAFGSKFHPFCAPFMTTILDNLDINLMMQGAKLFEGTHNFKSYCYKATNNGKYTRAISRCEILPNTEISGSFMPTQSYAFYVTGKGFMRNQIRLMMGALINLGKGIYTLDYLKHTLTYHHDEKLDYIAPASGLILKRVKFDL